MPVYDFRCPKCGQPFEVTRPRSEAGDPALCPQDGTAGERIWTSVGILRGVSESGGDGDFDLEGMGDMMGGMGGMGMDPHAGHMH